MDPHHSVFRDRDLTPDLLATQGRALRGLARSLLGDADAAEDVVQETWLACLRHPGALPERLSAWLATVTRNLALRRARGDGRRRSREARAATSERLDALQQRTLEREEALRAVTQALLALEEPLKTALLLRYYEERTPHEIADELGVPLATVKSRLARGLEHLRARLGNAYSGDGERCTRALLVLAGGHAGSLAFTAAGGAATGSALTTTGAMAMGLKLEAAVVVLALAGGVFFLWQRGDERRVERAPVIAAQGRTSGASSALSAAAPAQNGSIVQPATPAAEARREAPATPATEPVAEVFSPEASFPYKITGTVRDERDLPLSGASVFLGPRLFPINRAAETDDEGRFAIAFDGRRAALELAFDVDDGHGRTLGLRELHAVSGQELVLDVGLSAVADRGAPVVELRNLEADTLARVGYVQLAETSAEAVTSPLRTLRFASRLALGSRHSGPLERAPEFQRDAKGRGVFVDPAPDSACARPQQQTILEQKGLEALTERLYVRGLAFKAAGDGTFELSIEQLGYSTDSEAETPAEPTVAPGSVHGVVRDAGGAPAAGVVVGWGPLHHGLQGSATSDTNGAFVLDQIPPGEIQVRAGGGDLGLAREKLAVTAGQELTWNPLLERGDEVVGRVVRQSGDALPSCLIELWSVSSAYVWCASTLSNEDGRFAFANVPGGALELYVYATSKLHPAHVLPTRVLRPVFARSDLGAIVLAEGDLVSGALSVAVVDPDGKAIPGAEMRVWQVASGRGTFAPEANEEGKLVLGGLPYGPYRVEIGSPFGRRDLGTIWLDGKHPDGPLDLGAERIASPGLAVLAVEREDGAPALDSSLWSLHPDVFGRVTSREDMTTTLLALREGDYVLCAAARRETRVELPLRVTAAASAGLTLRETHDGALTSLAGAKDPAFATREPELVEELRTQSCLACHAGN